MNREQAFLEAQQIYEKEIADLQHKLEVAERATKLACKEIDSEYMYGVYRSEYPQYFKEQAEKELKGEEDVQGELQNIR